MYLTLLHAVGCFGGGLLAGTFFCSCLMEQAERSLNAHAWIAYKNAKEDLFGWLMPIFFGVVLLGQLALSIIATHRLVFGLSVALLVASLAITLTVHLPLNRQIARWSCDDPPAMWGQVRRR